MKTTEKRIVKETVVKTIYLLLLGCLVVVLPFTSHAFPPKKGDKDCIECHKLEKKDAETIVKKAVANGTVTDVKMSPIKGVWQIDVETADGKRGALYIDFSKKFLIAQLIPVEALDRQQPPKKVDFSKIPREHAVYLGSKTAPNVVVVFSDPDCPYCRELHKIMKQVIEKRKDIAFAIILNPLPMHKDAFKKAQSVQCSSSLEMLDDAFSGKVVPEPTCPPDQIEKNKALAQSLNLNGTPAMVRNDGEVHSGSMPEDKLIEWIDKK